MGKSVQVKPDYVVVPLPDGKAHNAGDIVALTDAEYAALPAAITRVLALLGNVEDPVRTSPAFGLANVSAKNPVKVVSATNVVLTAPGATLDGVTMSTGDRFLASAQTTTAQNGIYVWNGAASTATRSSDADTLGEVFDGTLVTVAQGTSAGTMYVQTATDPGTAPGTWVQVWTMFSSGGGGTSQVIKSAVGLGTQDGLQTTFTITEVTDVAARGLISRLIITPSGGGLYDIEVRSAGAGGGELFLAAVGADGTYDISISVYVEGDVDSSIYVGIKNRGANSRTYTLTTLRVEKFA